MSPGSVFHNLAAITGKARSPSVECCVTGTTKAAVDAERSFCLERRSDTLKKSLHCRYIVLQVLSIHLWMMINRGMVVKVVLRLFWSSNFLGCQLRKKTAKYIFRTYCLKLLASFISVSEGCGRRFPSQLTASSASCNLHCVCQRLYGFEADLLAADNVQRKNMSTAPDEDQRRESRLNLELLAAVWGDSTLKVKGRM